MHDTSNNNNYFCFTIDTTIEQNSSVSDSAEQQLSIASNIGKLLLNPLQIIMKLYCEGNVIARLQILFNMHLRVYPPPQFIHIIITEGIIQYV